MEKYMVKKDPYVAPPPPWTPTTTTKNNKRKEVAVVAEPTNVVVAASRTTDGNNVARNDQYAMNASRLWPQDRDVYMLEKEHRYYIVGASPPIMTSVSGILKKYFPFEPDDAVKSIMAGKRHKSMDPTYAYSGMNSEQISASWGQLSARGTNMHSMIEHFNAQEVVPSLGHQYNKEFGYFLRYQREVVVPRQWHMLRTEWIIYDRKRWLCGSIDGTYCYLLDDDDEKEDALSAAVAIDKHELQSSWSPVAAAATASVPRRSFTRRRRTPTLDNIDLQRIVLVDWKRVGKLRGTSFNGEKATGILSAFDNCNLIKYEFQLNLYKYLLEQNYVGRVHVVEMYIAVFHPDEETYLLHPVPDYQSYVEAMMKERDDEVEAAREETQAYLDSLSSVVTQ
jgi:hypothetical protein